MDRRQLGEENYRQKFETLGLTGRFEFIRRDWNTDHGRKVFVKCKACGSEFSTFGVIEIFKGHQQHLLCSECGASSDGADVWTRSAKCDEAMAFYTDGHSVRETAEMFNVPIYQINDVVKRRALTNGRDWRTAANKDRSIKAEQKLVELLMLNGFEYVGGYTKKDCKVKIKCQRCGAIFERCDSSIKNEKTICPECQKVEIIRRQEQREQERKLKAEQRQKEKEAERMRKNPLGLSFYQMKREEKLDEVYVCKVCGKEYTPRQYMESEGLTLFSNVGYCSHECKRKAENRLRKKYKRSKDSHRHRARKYGCEYDPTVTLERLIERDGLRCAICGEMCDPNDTSWSEFCGPLSPSIDHIIPMAKGGGHIWNNVQVAHIICNSYKSDNYEEV